MGVVDERLRGINFGQSVRVVTAVTTELTREACARHGIEGLEAVVMGRALTAGCLLATLTKNDDERVRLDIRGGGPVGQVLVDAHGDGSVRGCFTRRVEHRDFTPEFEGRASVAHLVGARGQLVVTRDLGLEQNYQGVLAVESGEVDLDLERYLTESEQLPSVLACEVTLDNRGGILRVAGVLCQTFPEAEEGALDDIEANLRSGAFADLMLHDRTAEELMGFALLGAPFKAMEPQALEFRCNCGRERALAVVSTLGAEDIEALAQEQGKTDVSCTYCGRVYVLSKDDLLELAASLRNERS
jgi:molecular chaperone Hsp33